MKNQVLVGGGLLLILAGALSVAEKAAPRLYEVVGYSNVHRIDRVIKSMEGAADDQPLKLLESKSPELLWVTAGKVEVVHAASSASQPIEMLCHSHLMFPYFHFDRNKHNALFNHKTNLDLKLFTLVQGQTEITLPRGFGIPVFSNEEFAFSSMIISPQKPPAPIDTKAKGTFHYYKDRELSQPLKPLYWRGLSLMVPVKENHSKGSDHAKGSNHANAEACASEMQGVHTGMPPSATPAKPSLDLVHKHSSGKYDLSYHWMVPPGRHAYRYTLEHVKAFIPFDTTIHYINLHLHPYAESMELRDLTTKKSIYKGTAKNFKDMRGIETLTHFSSEEGIPVSSDHEYELVAVYNNTTDHDIDAMAIMFVYFLEKDFDRRQVTLPAS